MIIFQCLACRIKKISLRLLSFDSWKIEKFFPPIWDEIAFQWPPNGNGQFER